MRNNRQGYLFIAPLLLLFLVFMGVGCVFLLRTSFQSVDFSFKDPLWVGLENYELLLRDEEFHLALLNNFLLSASSIFVAITLGFALALMLSFWIPARKLLTTLFFIPAMLPMAFMAVVFAQTLEYKHGLLPEIIRALGLTWLDQRWLADPALAMWTVCSTSLFFVGVPVMYYMADLSSLNRSVFEAALVDGAGLRQMVRGVIYPVLRNSHITIGLAVFLGGFREMERVYLMTDGGPGGATEIIGTYIYKSTRLPGADLGVVAAASVLVLVLALALGLAQLLLSRRGRKAG